MDKRTILALKMTGEDSEYPEFDIPEALNLSDLRDGEEREVLAVVKKKDDGTACIVSVDGVKLGKEEVEEEVEEEDEEDNDMPESYAQSGMAMARNGGLM